MSSYSTTFKYKGTEYSLFIKPYYPYVGKFSKYCFQVLINGYNIGNIVKNDNGVWVNLDPDMTHPNIPFELTPERYQGLGRLIEEELPGYV